MSESDGPGACASTQELLDVRSALTDEQFLRVAAFIERAIGVRTPPHKRELVRMRLAKRVQALSLVDVDEYVRFVLGSAEGRSEIGNLLDEITTNKTSFFREGEHFAQLSADVLPALLREDPALGSERPLLVWSAGCATGEEVFTLAMVLAEYQRVWGSPSHHIYGTDICSSALHAAVKAVYSEQEVASVPLSLRRLYLLKSKERAARQVRITPQLRSAVTFMRSNLLHDDPPLPAPAHIVFCRNVLIYFDRAVQEHVLRHLTAGMAPGGYLFVGHAEMLHGLDLPLVSVQPTIYRRSLDG